MADVESDPMSSTPTHKPKNREKKSIISPYFLIPCCTILLMFILWQLYQTEESFVRIFKSITAGCLLVYYSWELIYFDSLTPGIQPSSPLSPPTIRTVSGHTLHLNYALALMIGVSFTLFVSWYI